MFKKVFLIVAVLLVSVSICHSATLRMKWQEYEHQADSLTVWRLTESGREAVPGAVDIPVTESQIEFVASDTGCTTFFMTAKVDGIEGFPSETLAWCPEIELPPMVIRPGQIINITLEVAE